MTTIRWSPGDDYFAVTTTAGDRVRVRRASSSETIDGDVIAEEARKALADETTEREVIIEQRARR